jgi:DNA-binding HxlR family transcriptional regulator
MQLVISYLLCYIVYQVRLMARYYSLACPVARTLDIIGDRWTILILRNLLLEKAQKFQEFGETLPGLTPSVLSARLKDLEKNGIIESTLYAEHPPRWDYTLTAKGRELGPVLMALKRWGEKHA